jgi:general secretion pathway protein L
MDIQDNVFSFIHLKDSFAGCRVAESSTIKIEEGKKTKLLSLVEDYISDYISTARPGSFEFSIGIPGNIVMVRNIQLPVAVKDDVESVLKYEMEKYVPIPVKDICYDFSITRENKKTGTIKVLIAIVKKEDIKPYIDLKDYVPGGITGIYPSFLSVLDYLLSIPEFENCNDFIAVSPGLEEVDFVLVKDRVFDSFIHAPSKAEYKTALDQLLEKSGKSSLHVAIPAGKYVKFFKDVPEKNPAFIFMEIARKKYPNTTENDFGAFCLAAKSYLKKTHDINFLSERFRKKQSAFSYYLFICLVIILFIIAGVTAASSVLHNRMQMQDLRNKIENLKTKVDKTHKIENKISSLETRFKSIDMLVRKNPSVLDILKDLTLVLPDNTWLRKFAYKNNIIKIEGYADVSSDLITRLEKSSKFKNVGFKSKITKTNEGKELFRIEMKVEE